MIGDNADMLSRIKAVMPAGWFPTSTPILDGILSGPAYAWSWLYSMIAFVKLQARRLTASGVFLDMIAADFFGTFIKRRVSETDAHLNARIGKELFREKGTRAGLISALTDLTGNVPAVFEPAYTHDTGGYNIARGYNTAGGYGSLLLPFQFFVTAFRPQGQGVASVAGYGSVSTNIGTIITPTSGGSILDAHGNVYTMDTAIGGSIYENGVAIPGGSGTAKITVVAGTIWAEAAPSGPWYIWNGFGFVLQSGPPYVYIGMPGGYGVGAIEYANPSMFVPQIQDSDILAVINDVRPAATIAWVNISGASIISIWDAFRWDEGSIWS